jgi:SAM-dependent methyltransferase
MKTELSARQKHHYHRIHEAYEAHYFDASSIRYREHFIFDPLVSGLDLRGKRVADIGCGSGFNSIILKERFENLRTVGFDISTRACERYRSLTGEPAEVVDLTREISPPKPFDAAIAIGVLHHLVTDLPRAMQNIAAMIKPGGHFLIMEPSGKFFLNSVRKRWYELDNYFDAETERALSHDELLKAAQPFFTCEMLQFFGGPAYFLIFNSLITRVPLGAKPLLWPLLKPLETLYGALPWPNLHACYLARWRRAALAGDS